jgi:hypothetical protein
MRDPQGSPEVTTAEDSNQLKIKSALLCDLAIGMPAAKDAKISTVTYFFHPEFQLGMFTKTTSWTRSLQ